MDDDSLRRFARRDWGALAAAKAAYWAERVRTGGALPTWAAGQALLAHVRQVRPDFPTAEDRRRDIDHHLALRDRLDRSAHAFTRR